MTAENTHTHASPGAPAHPVNPAAPPSPPVGMPAAAPTPAQPGGPGRGDGRRKRRRLWGFLVDRGTELLAAILTLVAAVLGIWGAKLDNENEQLAAQVDSLEDSGGVLREDNTSLAEDLADMTASRDTWKSRAEAAEKADDDPTTGPTTGTTLPEDVDPDAGPDGAPGDITPDAAGIFRQTGDQPVTFANGYGIDLDSQESNWSVGSGGDVGLSRVSNGYRLYTYGRVALVSQEATYDQCNAQTVLQDDLTKEQTVVGRQFCMVTSENRWAYVKIIGLDPDRGTVTLHIVVYTLQTD